MRAFPGNVRRCRRQRVGIQACANGTVGQPGIGANAAQFLARIRELLETPLALLA